MKLAEYKNLTVGKFDFIPSTKDEVETELKKLLAEKVNYVEKEGLSALGDTVNINYKGFLGEEQFEGGTADLYDLTLGSGQFIPGFEEQLVGYEKGADVDVNVTFPEQYHSEKLAGQAVVFKCHINSVKVKTEPELNDDFAKSYNFPDLASLTAELERQMNEKKKNDNDNEYLNKLMDKIINESEVDVPEDLMKSRVDEMYSYYEQQVTQFGMDLHTYLAMQQMSPEQFRDQLAGQAMASAKGDVIFGEIAKAEDIKVSDEELEKELNMYQAYYNIPEDEFEKFKSEKSNDVLADILRRKVAVFLLENNN